jgi:hypothetical protein
MIFGNVPKISFIARELCGARLEFAYDRRLEVARKSR